MAANNIKKLAALVLPPGAYQGLRALYQRLRGEGPPDEPTRDESPPDWEYLPDGWPEGAGLGGWNVSSVVAKQRAAWPELLRLLRGCGPLGLAHDAPEPSNRSVPAHNTIMSLGYVLARAAGGRERLSVLDWGGGLGQYYLISRALLPEVELDYTVKDLPLLCEAGRELLPEVTFTPDDGQALAGRYDLVLASSSLQYSRDWRADLAGLCRAAGGHLFVTRTPFVTDHPSFVVVQRPHRYGYHTEYPGWFMNRDEFFAVTASEGMALMREFLIAENPLVPNAPEQAAYRGFWFRASHTNRSDENLERNTR